MNVKKIENLNLLRSIIPPPLSNPDDIVLSLTCLTACGFWYDRACVYVYTDVYMRDTYTHASPIVSTNSISHLPTIRSKLRPANCDHVFLGYK